MLEKVARLEALFEKDEDGWTKKERDRFKDKDGLRDALQTAEKDLSSSKAELSALRAEKTDYVAMLKNESESKKTLQCQLDKLPKIPTVVTLQDLMALDLPFKKKAGNENIADHVFPKTVDREYIFKDVLRFFVEREHVLQHGNSARQVNLHV